MSDEMSITIKADGPYIVSGGVPLRRKEPIMSDHGDALTWRTGAVEDEGAAYALCRCGGSSNKPYCDGTHAKNGFDGTEAASPEPYAETRVSLGGEQIEIFDDRAICAHAAFCGNQVTNIWKMADQTGDADTRAAAMAMVERCPSGALSYEVDGEPIEPDLPAGISVVTDGPLWVSGGVPIERTDSSPLERRNRVTLCRCGGSANRPRCDGSHAKIGFEG